MSSERLVKRRATIKSDSGFLDAVTYRSGEDSPTVLQVRGQLSISGQLTHAAQQPYLCKVQPPSVITVYQPTAIINPASPRFIPFSVTYFSIQTHTLKN